MVSCFMKYRKKLCLCILWKWRVDSYLRCISDIDDNGIHCRRPHTDLQCISAIDDNGIHCRRPRTDLQCISGIADNGMNCHRPCTDLQCISGIADNGIHCRRPRIRPISRLGLQHVKCPNFQLTVFPVTRFCLKSVLCCDAVMNKLIVRPTYMVKSVQRYLALSQKLAFRCCTEILQHNSRFRFSTRYLRGKLIEEFAHLVTSGRSRGLVGFILRSFCLWFVGCVGLRASLDALATREIFVPAGNQIHIFQFPV
jgi:hypothetical protein